GGKAPKVAITAAMRKLLIIANAIVQQDKPWANLA
ncbi:IS110 family transposase, partial [Sphingomonas sp. HH69]